MSRWKHEPDQLDYLKGFDLIPLNVPDAQDRKGRPVGKAPMHKNWRTSRPLSLRDAKEWMERDGNVGVRLRETDLIIDVDPRNFLEGDDPLARLERDTNLPLQAMCPTVRTGSGGLHLYLRKPAAATVRDSLEDYQGVEFKTFGRQVVAPGSVHPDTKEPYRLDVLTGDLDSIPEAPEKLLLLLVRPALVSTVDAGDVDCEQLSAMLDVVDATKFGDQTKWLEMMMACHHATAGEGRQEFIEWSTSDPAYVDHGWVIGRRWDSLHNTRGGRTISKKTLFKHVLDAGKAAGKNYYDLLPGAKRATAREDFADVIETIDLAADPEDLEGVEGGNPAVGPLERMNQEWCAVDDQGKFRIFRQKLDHHFDPPRKRWEKYARADFENLLANKKITLEREVQTRDADADLDDDGEEAKSKPPRRVPAAKLWIEWGERRTYDDVIFDPANRTPKSANKLNLWTDWAVGSGSSKGSWKHLEEMIFEALAGGQTEMFEYILNWIAHMIQKPDVLPGVALVFRGQKGVGKSTLGTALVKLAGQHGLAISDSMHLTNHFNAHLRDCIFLFSDEAMWGGNKQAEGTLKQLITESLIVYEAKGRDAVPGKNLIHIMMASNEDWVIPASMEDERRFAVGDVTSKYRGNEKFWSALNAELYTPFSDEDGRASGLSRFLWDMKMRDISGFSPRKVPTTAALATQKLNSLDYGDRWWFEALCEGRFPNVRPVDGGEWEDPLGSTVRFFTQDLRESLGDFAKRAMVRHHGLRGFQTYLGNKLRQRLGREEDDELQKKRQRVPVDRPDLEVHSDGYAYAYELPCLAECRAIWERQLGMKVNWDTGRPTY